VALILAPTSPKVSSLSLQIAPGQLLDVGHQAVQPPLRAHLELPPRSVKRFSRLLCRDGWVGCPIDIKK
jgi:hypothetical protein